MLNKLRALFGSYEAAESSSNRRSVGSSTRAVDTELPGYKRRTLIENARDLDKNFSLASWAIRRHLDYVSAFNFEPQTGLPELDDQLLELVTEYSQPENCHVARRHSLSDLIRMAEAARVVDGDLLLVKLSSGHLQAIEADRIANPPASKLETLELRRSWVNGVKVTKAGKAQFYAVHTRNDNRDLVYERAVRADNCFHHGYFQRFDQVRGVSPLASALNTYRDIYEAFDHALAKAKLTQMFGIVVNTNESTAEHEEYASGKYEIDPGNGPFKLELDTDEQASFLESGSPPLELQQFSQLMTAVALKALDIPFSFFDESFTNFFGSRSAFIHYKKACRSKIQQNQALLNAITRWRLQGYILSGRLVVPSGLSVDDLKFEWIPEGTPWWNPQQEVTADLLALKSGLVTRHQIVKEKFGKDWERDILPVLQKEDEQLLEARGFLFDTSDIANLGEVADE